MVKTIFNFIKSLFTIEDYHQKQRRMRDAYLAESHDLVDLERRMRELERNENLKGWV